MQKLYRLAVLFFVVGFLSMTWTPMTHAQGYGPGRYSGPESNQQPFDRFSNQPSQEGYTDQMNDQRYTDQRPDQFQSSQQRWTDRNQPSRQEAMSQNQQAQQGPGNWKFAQQTQPQQPQNQQGQQKQQAQKERELQFKKMIGSKVTVKDGSDYGTIKDLMVDSQGRVAFVLISHGGLWGLGETTIAVPVESLSFNTKGQKFALNAAKDELENAPTVDRERISESKVMQIYRFYGVQPYWTAESSSSGSNAY